VSLATIRFGCEEKMGRKQVLSYPSSRIVIYECPKA
jgi:hypothetical protein